MSDEVESGLERIVADLSRIRSEVETLGLPANETSRTLIEHLGLASLAALHLRFGSGKFDDLIVLDD
jgi:hypothetical protein